MKILNICLLPIVYCLCLSTSYAEIYRWVDSNGKVHFSDKPQSDQSTAIRSTRGQSSGSTTDNSYREHVQQQQRLLDAISEKRAHEQRQQAAAARQQQERQAKIDEVCSRYARYLETGGSIYATDENGERIYMKESEIEAFHAEKLAEYNRHCK